MSNYIKADCWDFWKRRYETISIPDDCCTLSDDLDAPARCPSCSRVDRMGDMFPSRRWCTDSGFGYMVCESCYEKEIEMERLASSLRGGKEEQSNGLRND